MINEEGLKRIFHCKLCRLLNSQKRYGSTWQCFRSILRTEGMKGFYRGVTTNMYKGFPGIAIEFYMYDTLKTAFFTAAHQTDRASKI